MGLAVWALVAYIAVIVVWNVFLKRRIGESMIVGFLVICLFAGDQFLPVLWAGLTAAFYEPVVYGALLFAFIGFLLSYTGLIERQVDMLNSLLGRLPGGAGYVATIGSALFGSVAHSGSANAATMGSVAVPWMKRSNWPAHISATVVAGNAGNGTIIPPSSSFFLLIGLGTVSPFVEAGPFILTMFAVAGWCILWRLIVVTIFIRRYKIARVSLEDLLPFRTTFARGWMTLLVFLGIVIPVLVTFGPSGESIEAFIGADAFDTINVIVWMPVMLAAFTLLLGFRGLPKSTREWSGFLAKTAPRFKDIGATLVFAFAGGAALTALGLGEQLTTTLQGLNANPLITVFIVALLVVLVAGPLSAAATVATIGGVGFSVLVAAGINPLLAGAVVLIAASTEGASPPGAGAIYIASGIAQVNPVKTFMPLILFYVTPFVFIATLIGMGWLPVPV